MSTTYDPNCVRCRYSRPGTPGDHRDHEEDPHCVDCLGTVNCDCGPNGENLFDADVAGTAIPR
jgi:hypothetical protein